MDFFEAVKTRQSIRSFTPAPIEPEKLDALLDAAVNQSPSAGNLQAYQVYVVRQASRRAALSHVANSRAGLPQQFLADAQVILVFCTDAARSAARYGARGAQLFAVQDATIACTYATLAAAAQGLASVCVGSFDPEAVREILGAPEGIVPITMLPIGYPGERPPRRQRRPMEELVHREPV